MKQDFSELDLQSYVTKKICQKQQVLKKDTPKKKKNLATKKRKFDTLSKLNKLTPDLHKLSRTTGHEPVRNN